MPFLAEAGAGRRVAAGGVLVAWLAAGCAAAPAPGPPPPPSTPSFTVPPPVTVTYTAAPTTEVTATPAPNSWTMPDLVGSDLQEAQDAIQELTDFEIPITTSHDETGGGREQLVDRNWKVCTQSVEPGEQITRSTRIDFGAVKSEERC